MEREKDKIQLELRKFVAPEYVFGTDARLMAANYCKQLGGRKVLLATDAGISQTPWLSEVESLLQNQGIDFVVFSDISPNPRDYETMNGVEVYRENNCNLILALGGGSVLDCAKGIGIVATNQKNIKLFEGVDQISRPMPPLICIPTTSGTSADVSQFAIINNFEERYKMAIISKAVVPDVALIDPVVLTSMNNLLSAYTGMDALSHAFEAFVSNASSAFTDLYSLEAIRLLYENLIPSIKDPSNIQLRGKVMLASLYAGLAFSNASLGCVHSLAHSLGGYLDLPHGECNAILLPHVVDFNFDTSTERYKKIAQILNLPVNKATSSETKQILIDYLQQMKKELGIISTLKQKGVGTSDVPILADKAIKDPCNATNPRPPEKDDLEAIYRESI